MPRNSAKRIERPPQTTTNVRGQSTYSNISGIGNKPFALEFSGCFGSYPRILAKIEKCSACDMRKPCVGHTFNSPNQ